jgi:hypothetical protein
MHFVTCGVHLIRHVSPGSPTLAPARRLEEVGVPTMLDAMEADPQFKAHDTRRRLQGRQRHFEFMYTRNVCRSRLRST